MKLKLTIDKQPLILDLETIFVLFGKSRTIEFAEGKWTPFVFCELAENASASEVPENTTYKNVEKLSEQELDQLLSSIPGEIIDFGGFVRKEIEKIENGQPPLGGPG